MKNKTLSLLLLLGSIGYLAAQSDSSKVVSMNFIVGQHNIDFSAFNNEMKELRFPALENQLLAVGGEFQVQEGRWLSSFGFVYLEGETSGRTVNTVGEVAYAQWEIPLRFGYDLIAHPAWVLSPELGTSFQWARFAIADRPRAATVSQARNTSVQKLTRFDVPVELSLHAQRAFQLNDDGAGLMLGLRGGYRFDWGGDEWRVDSSIPMANPGAELQGLFFELRFGILGPWSYSSR